MRILLAMVEFHRSNKGNRALTDPEIATAQTEHPPGDYAIVELFGHSTLVGRFAEVELFGSKMLALEPLFNDVLLPAVFHGGAAIYRMTPCSADVAWKKQPRQSYQLPPAIAAIVPTILLSPAPQQDGDILPSADDDIRF